jgi:hypothetical protein
MIEQRCKVRDLMKRMFMTRLGALEHHLLIGVICAINNPYVVNIPSYKFRVMFSWQSAAFAP